MESEFVELIRKAIGKERTQKQFAAEAGISAEHLSRIIRNPDKYRISDQVIEKISDHSEGRVSIIELKRALSMDITEEDKITQIGSLTPQRRNAIVAGDIKKGIRELALSRPVRYSSFDDFFDILHMLYGWGEMFYGIVREDTLPKDRGDKKHGAGNYAMFTYSWDDEKSLCEMAFVLYFCRTTDGGLIILDADFDMETLLEYGHPLVCEAEALMEGDGTEAQDHTIVYLTTYHPAREKEYGKPEENDESSND